MRARSWAITDKTDHYTKKNPIKRTILQQYGMGDIARLYLRDGFKVLDFGCGSCTFFDHLKPFYKNVKYHGYDIDKDALKVVKSKGYKPIDNLKKMDNDYDIIFMNSVIEHLKSDDAASIIRELSKKLKNGGKLIVETINSYEFFNNLSFWDDPEHEKMYSIKAVKELGEQNNLRTLKVHKHHIRLHPLKFLVNLLTADIYCGYAIVLQRK